MALESGSKPVSAGWSRRAVVLSVRSACVVVGLPVAVKKVSPVSVEEGVMGAHMAA